MRNIKKVISYFSSAIITLSMSGCATQYGCPLTKGEEGIGACSSIPQSFHASQNSNGNGYSVFDGSKSNTSSSSDEVNATPFSFNSSHKKTDNRSHFVWKPATIYRTWIAPYVDQDSNNLINEHSVYWVSQKARWSVPVHYNHGQASNILNPINQK